MTPTTIAELNLLAAIQLQAIVRDEPAPVREEAARAVLDARAQLAAERAKGAMRKGERS